MSQQISEPFHLTAADPGNTEADGTANAWSDIWKYQVPRGTTIFLRAYPNTPDARKVIKAQAKCNIAT